MPVHTDSLPTQIRPKILVSACLAGTPCRYDGCAAKVKARASLTAALAELGPHEVIAFCPEEAGGLATPRPPAWIESRDAAAVLDGETRLVTQSGQDLTRAFLRGAEATLEVCQKNGIQRAFMKERSPSCGVERTYTAAVEATGPGVTSALLERARIQVTGI